MALVSAMPKRNWDEGDGKDVTKKLRSVSPSPSSEPEQLAAPSTSNEEGVIVEEHSVREIEIVDQVMPPWQNTKSSTGQRLAYVFQNSELSDCSVTVGCEENQKTFNLHKIVLCMTSAKLMDMLLSDNEGCKLTIPDITINVFEIFLDYIYLDSLKFPNVEVAYEVYKVAVKFETPHLRMLTKDYLQENLNADNLCSVFNLAVEFKDEDLKLECGNYLSKFPLIWEKLAALSHDALKAILSVDPMNVAEIAVLKAVDRWATNVCADKNVEANSKNKREVIGPEVLSKIRFLVLKPQDFVSFCMSGSSPASFLSNEETLAILANLNVPGCLPLPDGFANCSVPRCHQRFRVSRRTIFKFCVNSKDTPDGHALSYPTQNSPVGSKNFYLGIVVTEKIVLHGVQVPTFWYPPFCSSVKCDYEENFTLVVLDKQNNVLAHKALALKVNYASLVDIFLSEPLELKCNETFTIGVSTSNTYYLSKKFRPVEVEQKVKFTLHDSLIPIHQPTNKNNSPDGRTDYGFIVQIIFSL